MKADELRRRLDVAIFACKSAGKRLIEIRNTSLSVKTADDQLKSDADLISDNLVKTAVLNKYPTDFILSEETYETDRYKFSDTSGFWILDPLDGTKSFFEGFDGFCIQVAFFNYNQLKLAVVYSPVGDTTYWALANGGAYKEQKSKKEKIHVSHKLLSYIDSKKAKGKSAEILKAIGANNFIECGSYGLKLCRVAEGKADIFIKEHNLKIWDVVPGDLILSEAGGILTTWSGEGINYRGKFDYKNLLACSRKNSSLILSKISQIVT